MSDHSPDYVPAQPAGSPSSSAQPPQATGPGPITLYRPPVAPPSHQLNPYEDKQWGTFAHLGGVAGFIPALVIYLNFKDRGRFARQESAEALNFQILVVAAYIVCMIFSLIPFIGLLFNLAMMGLWVANIVLSIMAGIAANKGEPYRYPMPLRFIS
ncbi:DUF4870 domain-containing protein [Arthrobacter sp. MPF02]|uniref:DUF4870 domain-containing protein n=1 Tax=Arthrobacter sp. MPF02 TaxID=3388492 RepID=UPI0039849DF2